MRHFYARELVRVGVGVAIAALAVACSDSDAHTPPIGAPTGPVIINEGGASAIGIGGGSGNGAGGDPSGGGSLNCCEIGGADSFSGTGNAGPGVFGPGGSVNIAGSF